METQIWSRYSKPYTQTLKTWHLSSGAKTAAVKLLPACPIYWPTALSKFLEVCRHQWHTDEISSSNPLLASPSVAISAAVSFNQSPVQSFSQPSALHAFVFGGWGKSPETNKWNLSPNGNFLNAWPPWCKLSTSEGLLFPWALISGCLARDLSEPWTTR